LAEKGIAPLLTGNEPVWLLLPHPAKVSEQ